MNGTSFLPRKISLDGDTEKLTDSYTAELVSWELYELPQAISYGGPSVEASLPSLPAAPDPSHAKLGNYLDTK